MCPVYDDVDDDADDVVAGGGGDHDDDGLGASKGANGKPKCAYCAFTAKTHTQVCVGWRDCRIVSVHKRCRRGAFGDSRRRQPRHLEISFV